MQFIKIGIQNANTLRKEGYLTRLSIYDEKRHYYRFVCGWCGEYAKILRKGNYVGHFIADCLPCGILFAMRSIIQFKVWREDDMYVAAAADAPIATEGSTFEELYENVRDAVATYFLGDDPASLGFERTPSILTNFEVPPLTYAGRT